MYSIAVFAEEIRMFSKRNWWLYIIYFLMLLLICNTQPNRILGVVLVNSIHFLADIFIMMMFTFYHRKEFARGTKFQILALLFLIGAKFYTGINGGGWQYLLSDPLYILAAAKNYFLDVKGKQLRYIDFIIALAFITVSTILVINLSRNQGFLSSSRIALTGVQGFGIFLFAIALSITGNEKVRYFLSVISLSLMVLGSAGLSYITWRSNEVVGLALSYTLLPAAVLIFYLRKVKFFTNRSMRESLRRPVPTMSMAVKGS